MSGPQPAGTAPSHPAPSGNKTNIKKSPLHRPPTAAAAAIVPPPPAVGVRSRAVPGPVHSETRRRHSPQRGRGRRPPPRPTSLHQLAKTSFRLFATTALYVLGPVLICLASALAGGLCWGYVFHVLPLVADPGSFRYYAHLLLAVPFFLYNVAFNYAFCVGTDTGSRPDAHECCAGRVGIAAGHPAPPSLSTAGGSRPTNRRYEDVVRDLADATGWEYPPTGTGRAVRTRNRPPSPPAEGSDEEYVLFRPPDESGGAGTPPPAPAVSVATEVRRRIGPWWNLGPTEWGYCAKLDIPKPPRSHFDHVTGTLVLNMDHYCPWMFNCVGYWNYRYFLNFLIYVLAAMLYGAVMTWDVFFRLGSEEYTIQKKMSAEQGLHVVGHLIPGIPTPSDRNGVTFCFMMSLSIGLAVSMLAFFHIYLVLTGQTTVEYHANMNKKRAARYKGTVYKNPYDLGRRRNFQQVYGTSHPMLALLPSRREPVFLPVPFPGTKGLRQMHRKKALDERFSGGDDVVRGDERGGILV